MAVAAADVDAVDDAMVVDAVGSFGSNGMLLLLLLSLISAAVLGRRVENGK